MAAEKRKQIPLRISEKLYNKLLHSANLNSRTQTAEITNILECALSPSSKKTDFKKLGAQLRNAADMLDKTDNAKPTAELNTEQQRLLILFNQLSSKQQKALFQLIENLK